MQLLLKNGSTGTHSLSTTALDIPITVPVLAAGAQEIAAVVEIPAGQNANMQAQLIYRFYTTDDSQSAGTWSTLGLVATGPGKYFRSNSVGSVGGIRIQLGLRLSMSSGTANGRARLKLPVIVTT